MRTWTLMIILSVFLVGCFREKTRPYISDDDSPEQTILPSEPNFFNSIQQDAIPSIHSRPIRDILQNSCIFPKIKEDILRREILLTKRQRESEDAILARWTHLDAFWAQEYIGVDLLREELTSLNDIEITNHIIRIVDSSDDKHGEYASHLIAGPSSSAIIPQSHSIPFDDMDESGISIYNIYENLYNLCQVGHSACPIYVGSSVAKVAQRTDFSRGFFYMPEADIIESMSKEFETVFISAAGNDSTALPEEEPMYSLAKQGTSFGRFSRIFIIFFPLLEVDFLFTFYIY